ncbi:MAG: hypothetical protein ACQESR_13275, partial [Planctomycetota bacterium]
AAAPFNILKAGEAPNSKLNLVGIGGHGRRSHDSLDKTTTFHLFHSPFPPTDRNFKPLPFPGANAGENGQAELQ